MTPDFEQLRKHLSIDKSSLDDELASQAGLFDTVGQAHVDAIDKRDALKEELAVIEAETENDIRETAERQKEKITEGQVKSLVKIDKDSKRAYSAYAAAKREADRLGVLKESFHQRAGMIDSLCKLYIANYFEQNSVRGTDRQDTAVYYQRREKLNQVRARRRD